MSDGLTKQQAGIMDSIDATISARGVEKFIIIAADPDSDKVIIRCRGDVAWRVGAMELQLRQMKREWDWDEDNSKARRE